MEKKTRAGLLAAAAAAVSAGYYFYASKNARSNRRIAAKWANDLKKDVINRAARAQKAGRKTIADAVDDASKAYRDVKNVSAKDLQRATRELKSNWQSLVKELPMGKTTRGKSSKR